MTTTTAVKNILVTGANDGIGLALVKQLTKDYNGVKVFLGARNATKGEKAVEDVKAHCGGEAPVELVLIDVNSEPSIQEVADKLKDQGVQLYGLVNNAGVGFNSAAADSNSNDDFIIHTNYYGAKRVTQIFLPLLQDKARIVMTGSGAGPMTVRNMPTDLQKKFAHPGRSIMEELEVKMQAGELKQYDNLGGYGVSKAMLQMYASALAKEYAGKYYSYVVSPGFINTKMTSGFGANLTPEEGTKSLRYCLFDATPEQSGWYFGSDAKRSPVHATREPGDPEFDGKYPF